MDIPIKTCKHCKKDKYIFEFSREYKNGLRILNQCKECVRKKRKPTDLEKMRKRFNEPQIKW